MNYKLFNFIKYTWKKIKENYLYIILLFCFFCIAFCGTDSFKSENSTTKIRYNKNLEGGRSPYISEGVVVSQKFVSVGNNITKIGLKIVMPSISTNSNVNVRIVETNTNKEIANKDIFLGLLHDGDFLQIDLNDIKDTYNKEYEIIIKGIDGDEFNSIQFPYSRDVNENLHNAYIENEIQENNFILNVTYRDNKTNLWQLLFWIILFIGACIYIIYFMDNNLDEKTFLKLAVLLGIFFILYTPIFHNMDEWDHYFRSLMISLGNFYDEINDDLEIGGYVSDNIHEYLQVYKGDRGISLKNVFLNRFALRESFSEKIVFENNKYFSNRIPLAHLIPAFGIFIGRKIFNNIFLSVILGRLAVYCFYVYMCYLALKNVNSYKSLFFVVATVPIAFWLAGTINMDPILNASSLLFVSICLKYYLDTEDLIISKKDIFLLTLSAIMLCVSKFIAGIPLLLLFFFIPKMKFKTSKLYYSYIIFAITLGSLLMIWQFQIINSFPLKEDRNGNVDAALQIEFIKNSPIFVSRIFTNNIVEKGFVWLNNFSYDGILEGFANSTGLLLIIPAILEKNKNEKLEKNKIFKWLSFTIFTVILIADLGMMYLNFSQVGSGNIEGFQNRYLISPMILLLIPFSNLFKIKNDIEDYEKKLVFIILIMNIDLILGEIVKAFSTYGY